MIAQIQTPSPVPPQPKPVTTSPIQKLQNDNWLYYGTDEAWLKYDYSDWLETPYGGPETTAYKLLQYEEDLDCYSNEPSKTDEQIWQEVEEFMASGSPDDFDEF